MFERFKSLVGGREFTIGLVNGVGHSFRVHRDSVTINGGFPNKVEYVTSPMCGETGVFPSETVFIDPSSGQGVCCKWCVSAVALAEEFGE